MSHLTYFKVQNFKCFDEIEVKDIGQFNLIVGDNNVGKTALMEAMMVELTAYSTLRHLYLGLIRRGLEIEPNVTRPGIGKIIDNEYYINFVDYLLKVPANGLTFEAKFKAFFYSGLTTGGKIPGMTRRSVVQETSISVLNVSRGQLVTENSMLEGGKRMGSGKGQSILSADMVVLNELLTTDNFCWCGTKTLSMTNLAYYYVNAIGKDRKDEVEFAQLLSNVLLSEVDAIRTVALYKGQTLQVSLKEEGKYRDIPSFGFGTYRFFEILLCIFWNKDGRVYVDEIDTGIHHSRLPEFLKTILKIAKDLNVQLFMTTHSKECEQAFLRILEDDKVQSDKFRAISLYRSAHTGKIVPSMRNYDAFAHALDTGHDIRM